MANAKQLEKGKWRLDACKNGKKKTFRGKSRGEVEKLEREWLSDLKTYGRELSKDSIKLSSVLYDHLFTNIKSSVSLGTFERYMSLYNAHIKDSTIGAKNIKDIAHKDLQKFFNSKATMSSKPLSMLKYLLSQAFDYAIMDNFIRVSPMTSIKLPKSKCVEKEIEVFTLQEQSDYMDAAEKLILLISHKKKMTSHEKTEIRTGLIDIINSSIDSGIEESKKGISRIVQEYSETLGVGESAL